MIAIFPETLACAAKGDIEELGVLVRRYYGGDETYAPCPDIRLMAGRVGMSVESLPVDALGALVAKDERGAFTIAAILSPMVDKVTERFLLAHMLGHFFIDIQPLIARGEIERSGFRENVCPARRYAQGDLAHERPSYELAKEIRADLFAAALLMPLGMVRRAVDALKEHDKVARFFGVSRSCLERRLADIGIVAAEPVNFLDAEAALAREQPESTMQQDPSPLVPPAEPAMPRSFAASTYGQTARTTSKKASDSQSSERPIASRTVSGGSGGRGGMKRLREIARQLDKLPGTKSET